MANKSEQAILLRSVGAVSHNSEGAQYMTHFSLGLGELTPGHSDSFNLTPSGWNVYIYEGFAALSAGSGIEIINEFLTVVSLRARERALIS